MAIIKVENVSFTYSVNTPFEKKALDDISFSIEKGDFVGIIGHTGSGKSTLVQLLNGLIKPDRGKIYIDGKDIWDNPKEIRNVRFKVGMVFQYPEHQLFAETVYKDIAFGPTNMGLNEQEIMARVHMAAKFTGLRHELLDKSPFDLSGGEKRRAAIAGVISMMPQVLILDEPTAGLDPHGRDNILSQILEYQKETGSTVLLVSHSMEDVARVAKRVIVMNHGKLEMFGHTSEVFSRSEELSSMGLSVPQITRIFLGLKQKGFEINTHVFTVEQGLKELLSVLRPSGGV